MSEHEGLPVAGYKSQSGDKVAEVNENKQIEERILRRLDRMAATATGPNHELVYDPRWIAIGRSHIEQGFMAINRAIFQPGRVELPEDRE